MSDENNKNIELKEKELEAAAGGIFGTTQNRWDPNKCNQYTEASADCHGPLDWVRCDHFQITNVEGGHRYKCAMGRFDYKKGAGCG